MDAFAGWPLEAPALLAELAARNTHEFWAAHRDRHEAQVRGPMRALAAALEPEFGPARVFRPQVNRRFRPDAPPYRTDVGAVAASPGGCVLGVVLTATALSVSAGHWAFDGPQLVRYRMAVAGGVGGGPTSGTNGGAGGGGPAGSVDGGTAGGPTGGAEGGPADGTAGGAASGTDGGADGGPTGGAAGGGAAGVDAAGAELQAVLDALEGWTLDRSRMLAGWPRGVAADHPHLELLRHRGLQVARSWEVGPWLATDEPLRRVREAWRAAGPLVAWLDEHVGPPDPVPPRPRPVAEVG